MRTRQIFVLGALGLSACLAFRAAPLAASVAAGVPSKLGDDEFWKLSQDMSEPNGAFQSDNLLSNEMVFPRVVPELISRTKAGGVYLGVGPEQNFTYIAAMQPKMVFITDIRRGNLQLHLMYKALFELSADRSEFVSRLFTKKRQDGLTATSSAADVMNAYWDLWAEPDEKYQANLKAIDDLLTKAHHLPLSQEDLSGIAAVYRAFYWYGPIITYNAGINLRLSPNAMPSQGRPSYADLMMQTDGMGQGLSYLGSEAKFRFLKDLESRNMLVPVVGNFAGPKALRAVGDYVREHGATVGAYYLSNVEQYLRQGGLWQQFCANVATMPVDDTSVFIRPSGTASAMSVVMTRPATAGGRAIYTTPTVGHTTLFPIATEVASCR